MEGCVIHLPVKKYRITTIYNLQLTFIFRGLLDLLWNVLYRCMASHLKSQTTEIKLTRFFSFRNLVVWKILKQWESTQRVLCNWISSQGSVMLWIESAHLLSNCWVSHDLNSSVIFSFFSHSLGRKFIKPMLWTLRYCKALLSAPALAVKLCCLSHPQKKKIWWNIRAGTDFGEKETACFVKDVTLLLHLPFYMFLFKV